MFFHGRFLLNKGVALSIQQDQPFLTSFATGENLRKIYVEKKTAEGISFRKVDKNKLKGEMKRVNQVIRHIETKNITETKELIRAATVWVAEQLGLKKTEFRAKKDPWYGGNAALKMISKE